MDSTIDEDDPKGEKIEDPMDEDGKRERLADVDAPKEQQPQPGKHNGAAQKEKGAFSGVLQSKEIGAQSAPAVVQANKKQTVLLSQCELTEDGIGHWKANVLNGGTVPLVRSSKRNEKTSGQDSLEKASKLKARKNLDSSPGEGNGIFPNSFHTVDDYILQSSINSLGIALGSSEKEVSLSLNSLRDLEVHRLNENIRLEKDLFFDDASSLCSIEENIDLEALNFICSGVSEGLGDGGCDLQTPVSPKKGRTLVQRKNQK
jgi:hypothetical protein